jgi:hypothetical protein
MRSASLAVFFHLDAIQAPTLAGFSSSLCLAKLPPMPWPKLTYPTLNQFQNQSLKERRDVVVDLLVDRLTNVIQVLAGVCCDKIGLKIFPLPLRLRIYQQSIVQAGHQGTGLI